jgi:GNAT superfamily N-acetyltransferase
VIEIRLGVFADAEAISMIAADVQAVHAAAHPGVFKPPSTDCFPETEIRALMASPDRSFFVALDGDRAVGYAYAEVQRKADSAIKFATVHLHLHQMGVLAGSRGRGIGSQLLGAIRDLAKALKISQLTLDMWHFNSLARAFYEVHGFRVVQERMWATTEGDTD